MFISSRTAHSSKTRCSNTDIYLDKNKSIDYATSRSNLKIIHAIDIILQILMCIRTTQK